LHRQVHERCGNGIYWNSRNPEKSPQARSNLDGTLQSRLTLAHPRTPIYVAAATYETAHAALNANCNDRVNY